MRCGWKVTKLYSHFTFKQSRFKKYFISMNQKSQQKMKTIEKDFYKVLNNANFGYDCRNNLDNCKFLSIFTMK